MYRRFSKDRRYGKFFTAIEVTGADVTGHFSEDIQLFSKDIGLFSKNIGVFVTMNRRLSEVEDLGLFPR